MWLKSTVIKENRMNIDRLNKSLKKSNNEKLVEIWCKRPAIFKRMKLVA